MAVAQDLGGDLDGVALAALGWVPSAVDPRRRLLDANPRRWLPLGAGRLGSGNAWHDLILHHRRSSWREPLKIPALERRPAARDLAARRSPRAVRVRVRGLARRGRPVVVAGASAQPAPTARHRPTARVRRSPPGGGCWPTRPPASHPRRRPRSAGATPSGSATGSVWPVRAPLTTRCASSASGAACARTRRGAECA